MEAIVVRPESGHWDHLLHKDGKTMCGRTVVAHVGPLGAEMTGLDGTVYKASVSCHRCAKYLTAFQLKEARF